MRALIFVFAFDLITQLLVDHLESISKSENCFDQFYKLFGCLLLRTADNSKKTNCDLTKREFGDLSIGIVIN